MDNFNARPFSEEFVATESEIRERGHDLQTLHYPIVVLKPDSEQAKRLERIERMLIRICDFMSLDDA